MHLNKRMSVGVIVACLALLGGAIFGGVADAKKTKVATVSNTTPRPIPDALAGSATTPSTYGKLATPLTVSKKFKGKKVGSVAVTVQTVGATPTAANDLFFKVTAPNGRTIGLDSPFTGQSIGPVTWLANYPFGACGGSTAPPPPPCDNPDNVLNPPYVGVIGDVSLSLFEGVKMNGTWFVSAYDANNLDTSSLNSVSLKITPAPTR